MLQNHSGLSNNTWAIQISNELHYEYDISYKTLLYNVVIGQKKQQVVYEFNFPYLWLEYTCYWMINNMVLHCLYHIWWHINIPLQYLWYVGEYVSCLWTILNIQNCLKLVKTMTACRASRFILGLGKANLIK